MIARVGSLRAHKRIAFNWYVDSVNGNDSNSGRSAGAPLKTIGALLAQSIVAGQRIGLACGSHWREQFTAPECP